MSAAHYQLEFFFFSNDRQVNLSCTHLSRFASTLMHSHYITWTSSRNNTYSESNKHLPKKKSWQMTQWGNVLQRILFRMSFLMFATSESSAFEISWIHTAHQQQQQQQYIFGSVLGVNVHITKGVFFKCSFQILYFALLFLWCYFVCGTRTELCVWLEWM